ncbi:ubiquinol-cytochrome C chaperone family protein [Chelativorans sp. AA-79]|uniref:ubiquinol-cytochrome C chaperone family protein n=1 Tax=Chelativorans sp. AA-79 TaxID=3028735 RepID=UPI0023F92E24|nr:ubiquinol-cytochrome C chaperone family protein [Chelativorans sp. AA-79]WEX07456.1 ubiquinol-cytochrome C chaperone family protein [Chelativorans sp. AA-79]
MFQWPFGAQKRARRLVVEALYGKIVAAARRPQLYADWHVPDTPLGRFEMLSLHLFLLLHRLRGETGPLQEVAQETTDHFFREVDHSLRELGIGDLGVPKRIKKLARMFYGRLSAYGQAVDAGDEAALAEALRRNIVPDRAVWNEAAALATYMMEANHALAGLGRDAFLAGRLSFPPLPQEE